jgi:hypothetical protein
MWLGTLACAFALTAAAAQTPAPDKPPANPGALPAPVSTRQTFFSIPFRVDQPADPARQPVEAQLLVSYDQGAHWRLYSKARPDQKQIPFRATADGEYWFAIRSLDRTGKFHPETISVPGLRVIVDTAPPKMQLAAECGQAGQVNARWRIDEPNLKPESLSIQYRASSDAPWQSVAIGRENSTVAENLQTGEVTWWPQPGSREIQIRAEAADLAGNKSVSHALVKIDQNAAPKPGSAAAALAETVARGADAGPSLRSAGKRSDAATRGLDNPAAMPTGPVAQNINPPIAGRYQPPREFSNDPELRQLPPGERPRMINTRLFELDYDMESVGPSGVSRVELWGTRDAGRTWRLFAVDDDNRSPISVSVDDEGVYGFRIVATSGAGLSQDLPRSGDLPSIWVGVDLTKPAARITKVDLGKGPEEGRMNIAWEAADKLLADRPVTLAFSQNPGGPWTTIATGLENSGNYQWTIDARVPPLIYLRLEVRDEAGNLAIYDRKEPVPLDQVRPSAKIREVRPVAKTGLAR